MASVEKACSSGVAQACHGLGELWRDRMYKAGFPEGFSLAAKARSYFEPACNGGVADGCGEAVWVTRHGDGTASRAFAVRGCDLGDLPACDLLADYLRDGFGGPIDADGAKRVEVELRASYTRRCRDGEMFDCANAGRMWRDGRGGPQDAKRAQEFFSSACADPASPACTMAKSLESER